MLWEASCPLTCLLLIYPGLGCGTSIASAAQRLPDIACASLGCANSNDLACGGESAIMIYEGPQLIEGFDAGLCNLPLFELGISGPFQIQVVFNTSLTTETAPITMISLEHQLINTDGINLQNVTDFTLAGILSVSLNSSTEESLLLFIQSNSFALYAPSPWCSIYPGLNFFLTWRVLAVFALWLLLLEVGSRILCRFRRRLRISDHIALE